jgi:hypothetical protein
VVTDGRRGVSRGRLVGPQEDRRQLETDADDVRRPVQASSRQPALVVGSTSGAIAARALREHLTRQPRAAEA